MIALLAEVLVLTQAPGLTAPEVERQVTIPVEQALGGLGAVESRSLTGLSEVRVQTNARGEAIERLQRVQLPPGIQPVLAPAVMSPAAWMRYTVSSDQFSSIEVRTLQDWMIRRSLLMVPGVGEVATCGGRRKRIYVDVDPQRLAAYKLALGDIHVDGGPRDIHELGETVLAVKRSVPVRLRDVAQVSMGAAPPGCLAFLDGKEVVVGVVQPRLNAPTDLAATLQGRWRANLPPGVVVQPFAAAQEIQLRLPPGASRESVSKLAQTLPGLVEAGALDDLEASFREVRVLLRAGAKLPALPPEVQVLRPEDAVLRVSGPDLERLDELAAKLGGKGAGQAPHLSVEPDRDALARFGLTAGDLAMHLQAACGGRPLGMLREGERIVEIELRLAGACEKLSVAAYRQRSTHERRAVASGIVARRDSPRRWRALRRGAPACAPRCEQAAASGWLFDQ